MAKVIAFPRADEPAVVPDSDAADHSHWSRLMLMAQEGDGAAYQRLLTEISPYLRAMARRHLGQANAHELEDAVQEILLAVHGIRHTYERGRPFKPWLATIASRRLVDLFRRRSYRRKHEHQEDPDQDFRLDAHELGADPEHFADRAEGVRRVREAIASLPPRQREALELLRLRELSLDEAAAHCRQKPGALKVACHRALKSLRDLLSGDPP